MNNRSPANSETTRLEQVRLLMIGVGYVGSEVAKQVVAAGGEVFGLTRSVDRSAQLQAIGVQPVVASWHRPDTLRSLPRFNHILVTVPHREVNDLGEQTHVRGLENLFSAISSGSADPHQVRWTYLSTTGVFTDSDGSLVNEQSPASPTRIGPRIALAAEEWLAGKLESQISILRLAGIYGPGRIPLAAKIQEGGPIAVPTEGFLNLIHVADIAQFVLYDIAVGLQQPRYVVSDGNPVQRLEFYTELARLSGIDQPTFIPPETGSPKARRATNKRIDPRLIHDETGATLKFPNYRSGLKQSLAG
ncbi:MAG TPA: hypothetical protein DDW52_05110 [Planctomycetaceae bacterium]|nr:hypothetical protein [Planctomycetaceae bacterium]